MKKRRKTVLRSSYMTLVDLGQGQGHWFVFWEKGLGELKRLPKTACKSGESFGREGLWGKKRLRFYNIGYLCHQARPQEGGHGGLAPPLGPVAPRLKKRPRRSRGPRPRLWPPPFSNPGAAPVCHCDTEGFAFETMRVQRALLVSR